MTNPDIAALDITPAEVQSGLITPEHLVATTRALQDDGVVVLNDIIAPDHIAALRQKMLEDLPAYLARTDAPFNFNTGNVQQEPPPFAPYLFQDVLLNDIVIAVTHSILGDGLHNGFYSGNTAVGGSGRRQPVHADSGQLWPHLAVATPAYALVVNVPVVDMSAGNGSTEIWPGTHLDTTVYVQKGDIKLSSDAVEARRAVRPPLQPSVRAGIVIIRDIRMWHAGLAITTDQARPMIAMIHNVSWWSSGKVKFPQSEEAFFQHPILATDAEFVDGPINYIAHGGAYDFEK
ncbi:MAG: phytanoyl-CoA dioxygenase family protein [Armatimonadota bacterium]|nr:phytanoyl-CoA dioxygenase family protein [Armatimonadota bacterium]